MENNKINQIKEEYHHVIGEINKKFHFPDWVFKLAGIVILLLGIMICGVILSL